MYHIRKVSVSVNKTVMLNKIQYQKRIFRYISLTNEQKLDPLCINTGTSLRFYLWLFCQALLHNICLNSYWTRFSYREKLYLIKILADITVLCPPSPTQYTRNRQEEPGFSRSHTCSLAAPLYIVSHLFPERLGISVQ